MAIPGIVAVNMYLLFSLASPCQLLWIICLYWYLLVVLQIYKLDNIPHQLLFVLSDPSIYNQPNTNNFWEFQLKKMTAVFRLITYRLNWNLSEESIYLYDRLNKCTDSYINIGCESPHNCSTSDLSRFEYQPEEKQCYIWLYVCSGSPRTSSYWRCLWH